MILHIDLNSFFARVEQQAQPHLRDKPVGILGKGHKGARTCVCAASPEAKKFGVKSGSSTFEARRLCPSIIFVPPDYPKYLDVSRRFMSILDKFSPWVEIFSIDEAFLALGAREHFQSIRDTALSPNAHLIEATQVAKEIKRKIREEFGALVTVSIGIAWGKVFAKLAGELQKPDGLTILEKATWLERVGNLPISELCGIGDRLENHLQMMGITTIRDLSTADAGQFTARFGSSLGIRLWQIGQGIDNAPVESSRNLAAVKSIGHQITLDHREAWQALYPLITKLTQKVGRRLRRAGLQASRLSLFASLAETGWGATNRHQPGIMTDPALLRSIHRLWENAPIPATRPVFRLGVVATNLQAKGQPILPIFPEFKIEEAITEALDQLRNQYGEQAIEWGSGFATEIGNLRDWRGPHAVLDR